MKKLKKTLALISAVILTGSMAISPVSAEFPDFGKAVYVSNDLKNPEVHIAYTGIFQFIDENGNIGGLSIYLPKAVLVKMAEGSELTLGEDSELWVSEVDNTYFEKMAGIEIDSIENLYMVQGFENADEAKAYCREIIKNDNVLSANLSAYAETNEKFFTTDNSEFEDYEVFSKGRLITTAITFEDNETAENFDLNQAEMFAENVMDTVVHENKVAFSVSYDMDRTILADILNSFKNCSEVTDVRILGGGLLSGGDTLQMVMSAFDNGDVNFDETIDLYDAIYIAKSIMKMADFNSEQNILADFNNDSEVNIYDAIEISKTLMA